MSQEGCDCSRNHITGHYPKPKSRECPVSYGKFPLVIYFTSGNVYVPMLLSQISPPSPSPTVSKCLFFISAPLLLPNALLQPRGKGWGGRFKREKTYVNLWTILVDIQQKLSKYCNYPLVKNKIFKKVWRKKVLLASMYLIFLIWDKTSAKSPADFPPGPVG